MNKPPTACRTLNCSGVAVERGYCQACLEANPAPATSDRTNYDDRGHRPGKHLYDTARWRHPVRGLRARRLSRYPICEKCHRNPSTDVHHIKDHRGDQVLFFDWNNLQALCKECHDVITASSMNARRMEREGKAAPDNRPFLDSDGRIRDYGFEAAKQT